VRAVALTARAMYAAASYWCAQAGNRANARVARVAPLLERWYKTVNRNADGTASRALRRRITGLTDAAGQRRNLPQRVGMGTSPVFQLLAPEHAQGVSNE